MSYDHTMWRIPSFLLICFLFVNTPGKSFGQALSENPIFNSITSFDGLPTTSVSHVTQDSNGFIYIGTWDGVYQYDGESFEQIYSNGRYVYADELGGVWISQYEGLAYYDSNNREIKRYRLPGLRFPEIVLQEGGEVYVGAESRGILKYDPVKDVFDSLSGQKPGYYYGLSHQKKGTLLFVFIDEATNRGKIGTLNSNGTFTYEFFPQPPSDPDRSYYRPFFTKLLSWGKDGTVVINPKGFAKRQGPAENWEFFLFSAEQKNLIADNDQVYIDNEYLLIDNTVWINHTERLINIDLISGELSFIEANSTPNGLGSISGFRGSKMFLDNQGVLWIPRFAYGLNTLNLIAADFGLFRGINDQTILDVLSAFELNDGSFWIGHRNSQLDGLMHFSADSKTLIRSIKASDKTPPPGRTSATTLSHPYTWAIHESQDGTIWAGTGSPGDHNGGLNRIDPNDDEIIIYRHDPEDSTSLPWNWVNRIFEDGSGVIWLNTRYEVASFAPKSEMFATYSIGHPGSKEEILLLDRKGQLIIQSEWDSTTSVFIMDTATKEIRKIDLFDEDIGWFRCFPIEDNHGRVWFATDKGFGYSDTSYEQLIEWIPFSSFKHADLTIQSISYDDNGHIWFATTDGILKYNPESKVSILFGYERGLQSRQFNRQLNHRGPSGKLYFSGAGGLNRFGSMWNTVGN